MRIIISLIKKVFRRLKIKFVVLKQRFFWAIGIKSNFALSKTLDFWARSADKIKELEIILKKYGLCPELEAPLLQKIGQGFNQNKFWLFGNLFKIDQSRDFWFSDFFQNIRLEGKGLFWADSQRIWQRVLAKDGRKADIRVIWELSRLSWIIPVIKFAKESTDSQMLGSIESLILSWLDQNKPMEGPNWICPMEIAIRGVCLIWIGASLNSKSFQKPLLDALIDHKNSVQERLEYFDRPNNHLLADLAFLVYYYWLIEDKNLLKNWLAEFYNQVNDQINKDGSLGEGSSGYHSFVMQMVGHVCAIEEFLGEKKHLPIFLRMKTAQNIFSSGDLNIGDRDSGRFIFGANFDQKINKKACLKNFGLSQLVYKQWRIFIQVGSPEHPIFKTSKAPTGHVHHNLLAMDISFDKTKIFESAPAAFYTASREARSFARSNQAYTTFGCKKWKTELSVANPFWTRQKFSNPETKNSIKEVYSSFVSDCGGKNCCSFARSVDVEESYVRIIDQWKCKSKQCQPIWSFILPRNSRLEVIKENQYLIKAHGKNFLFKSSLMLEIKTIRSSPSFGIESKTLALYTKNLNNFSTDTLKAEFYILIFTDQ